MSADVLTKQTYLPDNDADQLGTVLSFLDAHVTRHGDRPEPRYMLVGAGEGDTVTVPEEVHRALHQVVEALRAGKAVTVAPHSMTLTTQQAADLLGVSRPTVVRLIDQGQLASETPGVRRRLLKLADVLAFREARRRQQLEALAVTSVDITDEDDPESVRESLRAARKAVAARRRTRVATTG